jgi:hypothetical protein
VFAGKGIGEIADYEEAIIRRLDRKPGTYQGQTRAFLLTRDRRNHDGDDEDDDDDDEADDEDDEDDDRDE